MRYENVIKCSFIDRPNRFVARVNIGGERQTVHVKNTGRCRELLIPGAECWLSPSDNPARKTRFDLVTVRRADGLLVNIDSQAPNKVAREWLSRRGFSLIRPEYAFGGSRIDFYMERESEKYLMEVKGCTLERGGVGLFPDAPTERGVRHLAELVRAKSEGFHAAAAFVIQMEGVTEVRPNAETHPQFGEAMAMAAAAGVEIIFIPCRVTPESIEAL